MNISTGTSVPVRPLALSCMMLGFLIAPPSLNAAPGDPSDGNSAQVHLQADQPMGTSFGYLNIAGSSFRPLDSATAYSYPGNGCIAKTGGGNSLFARKVVLPDGALVRFVRLYYYDDSTSLVTAFFTTYDGAGNFIEHSSVGSENAVGGYGTTLSPEVGYVVNRFTSSINVVANLGTQNSSTLRFCGVRIAYDAPIIDHIFANGFDLIPL